MKRYDYRNDYKNWTKDEMKKHLPILQDKLLQNLGICESNADDYSKRISYLNSKINKDDYSKYQSEEWVNIQIEMEEDENSGSIMDEFKIN